MARAACAPSTGARDLSPSATKVVRLFHNPAGPSTERPPALDRAGLMRRAHAIARQARPHMGSYRAAFAYGLRAAWGLITTRREFAQVRARVAPRVLTPDQIAASRAATRRCGASMMPF
jgi:hypothetical protein